MNIHIKPLPHISVCFASDDNYAPYMRIAIKSLISNRDIQYCYDILILHSNISKENQQRIFELCNTQGGVTIRFINVSEVQKAVEYQVGGYYSIATNYRLFLLSEMFAEYDRMIYLDCDMIITGEISKLFLMDMEEKPLAAVEDVGMRMIQYTKKAVYINGNQPYNSLNYRRTALGMKHPLEYFNAGVILFDLKKCRELYSFQTVVDTLQSKKFTFNDQDTLNILFDGQVKLLDFEWNYQNNIDIFLTANNHEFTKLFDDAKRTAYQIIHYIGSKKPWNAEVVLGSYYMKYAER